MPTTTTKKTKKKTFGKQLRERRKQRGLTVEVVAKQCGISRSYLTLIENDMRLPGRKNFNKIASALSVETGTVLNWYLEHLSRKILKDLKIT